MNNKVYDKVLSRIFESLERGVSPWSSDWSCSMPVSMSTGNVYSGINFLVLGMAGFNDPRWCTYKYAKGIGAQVRKGEKGTPCIYYKQLTVEDKNTGKDKRIPFLRCYTLFNASQCDGIACAKEQDTLPSPQTMIDSYLKREGIGTRYGDPAYIPAIDTVSMPIVADFNRIESYYSTYFHELTHSTGAKNRLNRELSTDSKTSKYGKEELTAELGAAFLCSKTGVDGTIDRNAAYCQGWLKIIKEDPRILTSAASKASKAVEYIANEEG